MSVFQCYGIVRHQHWVCKRRSNITTTGTKYLAYNVSVSVSLKHSKSVDFPAVTLCNNNPTKRSVMKSTEHMSKLVDKYKKDMEKNCNITTPSYYDSFDFNYTYTYADYENDTYFNVNYFFDNRGEKTLFDSLFLSKVTNFSVFFSKI